MGASCCNNNFLNLEGDQDLSNVAWDITDRNIESNKGIFRKMTQNFQEFSKKILVDISNSNFLQFNKYYKRQQPDLTSSVFIDKIFPPEKNSMVWVQPGGEVEKDLTDEEKDTLNSFKSWIRAKDIFSNNNFVLYEKFDIEDINQGDIGNCYFLSTISAIAEYGERFKEIFVSNKKSENGCYQICLYLNGLPKIIILDDHFPCRDRNRPNWNLAHCNSNEIWVQLLEKAWAKVNGSYASTIAGLPSEAFSVLTEAPCFSYFNNKYSSDELWKIILEADLNKFIICTNSKGDVPEMTGIVKGHAYTIISAYEFEGVRLLKLRNPWGNFEWTGDYSDKSDKWTQKLKNYVNFENCDDGVFYMTVEDFQKYYPYMFICKYKNNFFYEYVKFEQKNRDDFIVCKFTNNQLTNAVITLHQKQQRFYHKINNYKPAYGSIILARYDVDNYPNYEYYGSSCSRNEKIHFELDSLPPGEYHILANVNWVYKERCTYVISLYSEHKIKFEKLEVPLIPTNYLLQIFNNFIDKKVPKEKPNENVAVQMSINNNNIGFYICKFSNYSNDQFLRISLEIKRNERIYLCKLNLDGLVTLEENSVGDVTNSKYEVLIGKNSNQIIAWRLLDHPGYIDYKIQNCSFNFSSEIPKNFLHEKDQILKFIEENLENTKEQVLDDNLFLKELEYDDSIVFVVMNKSFDASFLVKIKFLEYSNLNIGRDNTRHLNVESNSKGYFLIKKNANVAAKRNDCEYKICFSVKRN